VIAMSARDVGIVVLVVLGVLILLPLLGGAGMMGGLMGHGMMGGPWGGRWGWGWGLPLLGGLFWLLVIVGIVLVVTSLVRRGEPTTAGGGESALDILKRRLARGEITLEEYERLKKELE